MPPKPKKEPKESRTLNILGLEIPLTGWAISMLAGLAVIGVALILYTQLLGPYLEKLSSKSVDKQLEEFQKHFNEIPDYITEAISGKIKIAHYDSDGCLLIGRRSSPTSALSQAWVLDPDRIVKEMTLSPGKIAVLNKTDIIPRVDAAEDCTENCLDPHPGEYKSWTGEVRECWQQVWFQWEDGCVGYVWYNTCYNTRDPKFYWVCCKH